MHTASIYAKLHEAVPEQYRIELNRQAEKKLDSNELTIVRLKSIILDISTLCKTAIEKEKISTGQISTILDQQMAVDSRRESERVCQGRDRSLRCWQCGKGGHIARTCRVLPRTQVASPRETDSDGRRPGKRENPQNTAEGLHH